MSCALTGIIAGIDEAGRGPLAGPVVSCCVLWKGLPAIREKVADSKLLSEKERKRLFLWITGHAYRVGIGVASHQEIDRLNIHHASLLSMDRALQDTGVVPDLVLIDGLHTTKGHPESKAVVKGDRKCFFVASASIVAKVVRDSVMEMYDRIYPVYGFARHKGYPTRQHRSAIEVHGPSPIHRRTFRGVSEYADL
jgi:ribonuclease HII